MKRTPWVRLAANYAVDGKLRRARSAAVWPWVLCRLKDGDGTATAEDLAADFCAADLLIPLEVAEVQLAGLYRVELLVECAGGFTTPNWSGYQPKSTERVKAWRNNLKQPETVSNVSQPLATVGNQLKPTETTDGTGRDVTGQKETPKPAAVSLELPSLGIPKAPDPNHAKALEVLNYWASARGGHASLRKTTTKGGRLRIRRVKDRLAEDFSVEQLKMAVDGCLSEAFNVANGHTDLELICRDEMKIRRYGGFGAKKKAVER